MMLKPQDFFRLPKIYKNIRLRRERSSLLILICETEEIEEELIQILREELEKDYQIYLFHSSFAPLVEAKLSEADFAKSLFFFHGYHSSWEEGGKEFQDELVNGVNLTRELIPELSLKCLFFCTPAMDGPLQLQSADFYQFKVYSHFFAMEDPPLMVAETPGEYLPYHEGRIKHLIEELSQDSLSIDQKAFFLLDLGQEYMETEQYTEAASTLREGLETFRQFNNERKVFTTQILLGKAELMLDHNQEALRLFRQTLQESRDKNIMFEAESNECLGILCLKLEQWENSMEFLQEALAGFVKLEQKQKQAEQLRRIGWAYQNLDNIGQAEWSFNQAKKLFTELDLPWSEQQEIWSVREQQKGKSPDLPLNVKEETQESSFFLRPTFTRWIQHRLEKGDSLNLFGPQGSGKTRLLEDLQQSLEKEEQIQFVLLSMKGYQKQYETFVQDLARAAQLKTQSDSLEEVIREWEETNRDVFLCLDHFDTFLENPDLDSHFDIRFLGHLNSLKNHRRFRLLLVTQKPESKWMLYQKGEVTFSPLDLNLEEISPLREKEMLLEMDRWKIELKDHERAILLEKLQEQGKSYQLLEYFLRRILNQEDEQLSFQERLQNWSKKFRQERSPSWKKRILKFIQQWKQR